MLGKRQRRLDQSNVFKRDTKRTSWLRTKGKEMKMLGITWRDRKLVSWGRE